MFITWTHQRERERERERSLLSARLDDDDDDDLVKRIFSRISEHPIISLRKYLTQNTLTASLRRGKTSPNKCPGHGTKQSDCEALGNAEYSFIAIASSSQLARSDGTW